MVVGTLSLKQKGQTRGRSTQWHSGIWWWGHCLWCKKGQTRGCSGCSTQWNSGILSWGHCSLVQKGQTSGCSVQWTQWNSDISWWGHCSLVQKGQTSVHCVTVSTGLTFLPIYHYSTAFCINCVLRFDLFSPRTMSPPPYVTILLCTAYCIHCILWFDLFAPKTMSPPPYTTILLRTVSAASSGLTILYQRQCPHHHIPLFHCIHCILHPLV